MFLVHGDTSRAIPYYGVGVFLPIGIMALAIRKHVLATVQDVRLRYIGAITAGVTAIIAGFVFVDQLFARWEEGGWFRLVTFATLFISAHLILMSSLGKRTPEDIKYIVRDRARVQGAMASIVEWQSLKMQEYRYHLRAGIVGILNRMGLNLPLETAPVVAGPYNPDHHID
jgi:hypothetical protein